VQGAFRVRARHVPSLRDKRVLVVDDVMTTGATVEACARGHFRDLIARQIAYMS
jgi:predicted amidophosphoribosyltransferase